MSMYLDQKNKTWVVQIQRTGADKQKRRRCQRVRGTRADALAAEKIMTTELEAEVSADCQKQSHRQEMERAATVLGLAPNMATTSRSFARPPTLRAYYSDRIVPHIKAICSDASKQKVVAPWQYLLYRLGDLPLDEITTEVINRYAEQMVLPGAALSFHVRKDGKMRKPKTDTLGAPTVNKQLQQLKATLRLAAEERTITAVPIIRMLPADDAQEVVPPSEEQFDLSCAQPKNFET